MKWLSIAAALALSAALPLGAQAYQCNNRHYVNSSGVLVHSPSCGNGSEGHETAICRDGGHSYSMHHSGTRSHHGGVAQWD
jgi:allantoicase